MLALHHACTPCHDTKYCKHQNQIDITTCRGTPLAVEHQRDCEVALSNHTCCTYSWSSGPRIRPYLGPWGWHTSTSSVHQVPFASKAPRSKNSLKIVIRVLALCTSLSFLHNLASYSSCSGQAACMSTVPVNPRLATQTGAEV